DLAEHELVHHRHALAHVVRADLRASVLVITANVVPVLMALPARYYDVAAAPSAADLATASRQAGEQALRRPGRLRSPHRLAVVRANIRRALRLEPRLHALPEVVRYDPEIGPIDDQELVLLHALADASGAADIPVLAVLELSDIPNAMQHP